MKYELGQIVGPSTHDEIDEFLKEWKPSLQKEAPTGWIWCHLAQAANEEVEKPAEDSDEKHEKFEEEGQKLVEALIARCKEIKETAPTRAKKGEKSQKALREEEFAIFGDKVKFLAQEYNVLSGKWMFFPSTEYVDSTWSKIVKALADADGVLAKTGVIRTAKVAPIAREGEAQLICVYVNDSWDKEAVGKAFKCLVEELKLVSTAYKCDAFTILGIDSKHETGIKSSLWSKNEFMSKDEIDAALAKKPSDSLAEEVKKKTLEDEQQEGLGDFDAVSDSEDEEPKQKRQKK
ncbi:uncharacterized protein JCM6883_001535 [Sporobolomyces salmoneus]|uniref:uncharacterized protein n=1 Tax=Sporobolomyces salmoneus TaxID=183962 RepID=UPI00317B3C50